MDNAYGFTENIHGPASVRRNDWFLLMDSQINNKFQEIQEADEDQYVIFGDSAYGRDTHVMTYHSIVDDDAEKSTWNKCMKHVRISIEWNYGTTANLFKMVRKRDKLQLMKNAGKVSEIYTVATLFRNFHIACYGCQSSNYFNLELPKDMLHNYITQTDFSV